MENTQITDSQQNTPEAQKSNSLVWIIVIILIVLALIGGFVLLSRSQTSQVAGPSPIPTQSIDNSLPETSPTGIEEETSSPSATPVAATTTKPTNTPTPKATTTLGLQSNPTNTPTTSPQIKY